MNTILTASINNLSVFCADIGSIKAKKFGWAAVLLLDDDIISGTSIEEFASRIANEISSGRKVSIGFECPLFVPVRSDPQRVNGARQGEGNRSWSAGAGTGALATGLVEVLWVMNRLNELLPDPPTAQFNWSEFVKTDSVFLWEAFVTAAAKGQGHVEDAQIAIRHFLDALPDPESVNAIQEENVLSLVGAAALRAGWTTDIKVLSQPCLVIKA